MIQKRLESIRKKLLDLREARLQEIRRQNADAAALIDEGVADTADQGLTDSLKDYLHLLGDAGREEILEIDEALERLRDGSYGRCEACGKTIDIARLEILPFTRRCLTCRQEAEKEAKTKAGPGKGLL
ncbi:zinc finger transcriptional regulator, TraR/DksA family [Syntrophotalea carbinolica DSM 2380]|uniref:Zinc finger transcriptional regulator, TraR/DksA family n=1 Tax=Syntrophotalea carbinolica (strain DSM 2380 / NBRC 103641 / GraBd1) TaxID=338963 RepID=Q3A5P4_SYNC1|nr:TraR/DksA C4-type zinc finger protein [Syntrophotalea carbinolica]ABA88313.1 zinc finger transcriptional regulator, TraR/DksA family [Syntrophotalea carbinolica DSM 2380]